MSNSPSLFKPRLSVFLAVAMMVCLVLLINLSFKIILLDNILFTATAILCPIIALLYLTVLHQCSMAQQKRILHNSLLTLYIYSIGMYLMLNLPSAEHLKDTIAYQIVFENIPRKFFASTIAFGLSFYLPHFYFKSRKPEIFSSSIKMMFLALGGGLLFFSVDFILLFSLPVPRQFYPIGIDSFIICAGILLCAGIIYRYLIARGKPLPSGLNEPDKMDSFYHYLVGFSVTVLLICLACEYRLVSIFNPWILSASAVIFPLTLMSGSLVAELYGFKANWSFTIVMIFSELVFDLLLMVSVMIPSPEFFNLNPFYHNILPRRIPATTLSLLLIYSFNAWIILNLKKSGWRDNLGVRIFFANFMANSLMCLVNYSILFSGVYPGDLVFNIGFNSWVYKNLLSLLSMPLILWIYRACRRKYATEAVVVRNETI